MPGNKSGLLPPSASFLLLRPYPRRIPAPLLSSVCKGRPDPPRLLASGMYESPAQRVLMEQDVVCGMSVDRSSRRQNPSTPETPIIFAALPAPQNFGPIPKVSPRKRTDSSHAATLVQSGTAQPVTIVKSPAAPPKSAVYVCPMTGGAPGSSRACPKCGMSLEPDVPPTQATRNRIHLPHASRNRRDRARLLSDLRHGT